MNPTVDNDLQKAIDDITKNTNADPVFSDPVAAPSSIPEGDSGNMSAQVGPIGGIKPAPRPAAPRRATPATMPMPPIAAPTPTPVPITTPLPPAPEPVIAEAAVSETVTAPANSDMREVKEAALRDLAPLLSKIDMDSSKKFKLYKSIREELHDDSVIGDAYAAAKGIADDTERGEALLYLVESIDNM